MSTSPYIKLLDIYYGARCNLACNQCDTRSDVIRGSNLDPELDNILEGISLAQEKFEIDIYSVIGGEPLLYLDKIDVIISYIRKSNPNAKIIFSTNGTLLLKKAEELSDLLLRHSVSLFVCNHFAGFDPIRTKNIAEGVDKLVSLIGLEKGDANAFFRSFIGFDNKRNDPYMGAWIKENEEYFFGDQPNDHYYHNNKIFVHFRPQYDFKKNHFIKDGKPKPFKTNDPDTSYKKGCSSVMCNFLVDKKLYKCAALGTLDKLLDFYNSKDDPDWQKYLNYKPLDLENCSQADVEKFSNSKFCSISECDMCGVDSFIKTKETVIYVHSR
jgi:hypothetical protein